MHRYALLLQVFAVAVVLMILVTAMPRAVSLEAAAQTVGSISGVVEDEDGNPIAGASVYASEYDGSDRDGGAPARALGLTGGPAGPPTWSAVGALPSQLAMAKGERPDELSLDASAVTAGDGSYTIAALQSGDYQVWAGASGRTTEYYDNVYRPYLATPVPVSAPDDTPNIDFVLEPGGSISGVVEGSSSNPIVGATVSVWGYAMLWDWHGFGSTGGNGTYTISGLPSGTYMLRAGSSGYAAEYYDDVYVWQTASPVTVIATSDTPNIDFVLGPGGSVSGIVKDGAGNPIEGASVLALDYASGGVGVSGKTQADGSYTLFDIPPGSSRVSVQASGYAYEWYDNVHIYECWDTATPVPVAPPGDTPNIDFALEQGALISGVVEDEAGNPIAGAWVCVQDYASDTCGVCFLTAGDGSYTTMRLPSGSYRVYARATGYITEYYDNVYEPAGADVVQITAPSNTTGIDFVLGPPVPPGDANGDGVIDGRDVIRAKKIILGLETKTPGADANEDGVVDGRDVIRIKKMILGIS